MTIDITFFLLAIPAVIFAGISKGGFGSGAAFAATPVLALILSPAQALGLMLTLLMLMDLGSLRPYWKLWNSRSAKVLIAGAVPGVLLGMALLSRASPDAIRLFIGAMAISFVVYRILSEAEIMHAARREMSDRSGLVAGFWPGLPALSATRVGHRRRYFCCRED